MSFFLRCWSLGAAFWVTTPASSSAMMASASNPISRSSLCVVIAGSDEGVVGRVRKTEAPARFGANAVDIRILSRGKHLSMSTALLNPRRRLGFPDPDRPHPHPHRCPAITRTGCCAKWDWTDAIIALEDAGVVTQSSSQ